LTTCDSAGALADLDVALEPAPDHATSYVNRGTARKQVGDLPGALADLDRALVLTPARQAASVYHAR
jgi:hypothetical protein